MPLDELRSATRNPKQHTPDLAESIDRFGFNDAVIIDERTGQLVAGHGRLGDTVRRRDAGSEPPDGVLVGDDGRWLLPVQRGWTSRDDLHAEAFLVAHNRLTEQGGWDDGALVAILEDISQQDATLLDAVGYDAADIDRLLQSVRYDADGEGTGPAAGDGPFIPDGEDKYREQYGVIVTCDTEDEQQQVYEQLVGLGLPARVVTT